jgi:PAS domain S-box-containing protein
MLATAALGLLALGGAGAWFYFAQRRYLEQTASANLLTVAQNKLDQILAWRAERLGDAALLQDDPFFVRAVERRLAGRQPDIADVILTRLRRSQIHSGYDDERLVDRAGRVVLAASGHLGVLDPDEAGALREAFRDRRPTMGDVYVSPGDSIPHLVVVAPLFASNAWATEPLGAVVHTADPRRSLFRLVESWPSPSPSAEAVLVRRDADSVLFLSERRFQTSPAPPGRISLSRKDLPAVMAVLGTEGVVRTVDYRGVKVLAVLRAVPGTSWFLVAKVDEAEALAVWRLGATLVFVLVVAAVLVAGATAAGIWQRNAKAHYRRLYEAEAAVGASEARFRTMMEEAGDGFALLDAEGRYLEVNSECCQQLGYAREELLRLGISDTDLLFGPRQFAADFQSLVGKPPVTYESAHRRKDGTTFPVEVTLSIVRLGGVPQALALVRDITERKQALQALRESEERYRLLFDGLTDAVFVHGTRDDDMPAEFLAVNDAACERLGYTRNELLHMTYRDLDAPEATVDPRPVTEGLKQGDAVLYERTHVTKDGRRIPVEIHSQSFPLRGRIVVLSVVRDISDRARAEQAVRQERDRAQQYLDIAGAMLVGIAEDQTITLINHRGCEVLGYEQEELLGRNWIDLCIPEPEREAVRAVFARLLAGDLEPFRHVEGSVLTRSGRERRIAWRNTFVSDASGRAVATLSSGEDITERKQAEVKLRALARHLNAVREEEHTRMAREVHDELGQALTALRLDLTWVDRKLPKGSTALRRRIHGAVALTDEMITVGQRIVGELRPPILADLGLVPAVEWYVERFAKRSGLRVEVDAGAEDLVVPDDVAVSAYRIVQEALTNVARHARALNVAVRLGVRDGALTMEIRDDGQGLPEGAVDSPRSVGLVGMRERAAAHGGDVAITSSPGTGTTVRATFPPERRKAPRSPG